MPRSGNARSWLYRIRPAVVHSAMEPVSIGHIVGDFGTGAEVHPNQMRWQPLPLPEKEAKVDFVEGLVTMGACGCVGASEVSLSDARLSACSLSWLWRRVRPVWYRHSHVLREREHG